MGNNLLSVAEVAAKLDYEGSLHGKMNKYIELEVAINAVKMVIGDQDHECKAMMDFYCALRDIPVADVVPVIHEIPVLRYRPERYERYEEYGINENGETLYLKRVFVDEKSYAMYCPSCGKRLCSRFKSYCPNCGAKMDGDKDAN